MGGAQHMKSLRRVLLGLALLTVFVIVAALSVRAVWQHRIANAARIDAATGIDDAKFIKVNSAEEWITIRGDNKDRPIILFLHGGPSEANSPFIDIYTPFEKDYVFVQWDQPGAGKTYIRAGVHQPTLAIDTMAADGVAVAQYVTAEMHKPKVILIGQDWGGLLGMRMIERRPDLFAALVGTGQIISMFGAQAIQYQAALSYATAGHDQAMLGVLLQIGPPPYRTLQINSQFQECCRNPLWPADDVAAISRMKGALIVSPSLSIPEIYGWTQGLRSGEQELDDTLMAMGDLQKGHTTFSVPVFFIQGQNDNVTPTALVANYISTLEAPVKKLDVVPNAGHFVMWTHPAEFLHVLGIDLRALQEANTH
jgi:pimeloyl-ACP methyl ester carboxylesterase